MRCAATGRGDYLCTVITFPINRVRTKKNNAALREGMDKLCEQASRKDRHRRGSAGPLWQMLSHRSTHLEPWPRPPDTAALHLHIESELVVPRPSRGTLLDATDPRAKHDTGGSWPLTRSASMSLLTRYGPRSADYHVQYERRSIHSNASVAAMILD
jgi:hypothetical protein